MILKLQEVEDSFKVCQCVPLCWGSIEKDAIKLSPCRTPSQARFSKGSSSYRGVSRDGGGKWRASIRYGGKYVWLGLHKVEADAAAAYDRAAIANSGS